jgi:hypothetical protein
LARVRAEERLNIPLKVVSPTPGSTVNSSVTEFYLEDCNEGPSKLFEGPSLIESFMTLIEQENLEMSQDKLERDRRSKRVQAEMSHERLESDRQLFKELQNKNSVDEQFFALQDLNTIEKLKIMLSTRGRSFSSLRVMRRAGEASYVLVGDSAVALTYKWAVLLAVLENLTPKLRVMIELDTPWGKVALDESLRHLRAKQLPKVSDITGVPVEVKEKVARYFTFTFRAIDLTELI